MLRLGEDVLEAPGVQPKRGKHQESNAETKRERHQHLQPDVNRPSEREHLLETYSVKYEFRAQQIGECAKTELDLFSVPPTQVSLEKGLWIDHQPVSSVSDRGPITFLCLGTEDYVDLSKTILVVRAKVTKANRNDPDQNEKVGIVNNFLHSLFKQVDVFLKEKQVTQATGTYAYRAYLETLLNYSPAAKESQLTAAMFYKNTAGKMDVADKTIAVAANANHGLKK